MKRSYEELMKEFKEKWNVENIASVLDSLGIEYEIEKDIHIQTEYQVTQDKSFKEAYKLAFHFVKHDKKKERGLTYETKYKHNNKPNKLENTKGASYTAA